MQARGARRVEERSADNAYSRSARHKATSHIRLLVQPGAHRLRVRAWCSAIDVKQRLRDACGVPVGFIRLFHGPRELPNLARMIDLLPSSSRNSSSSSSSRSRVVSLTMRAQNPSDFATGCYLQAWGGQASRGGRGRRRRFQFDFLIAHTLEVAAQPGVGDQWLGDHRGADGRNRGL